MNIVESAIQWSSHHDWARRTETRETLRAWIDAPPHPDQPYGISADQIEISNQSRSLVPPPAEEEETVKADGDTLKILIVEELVALVTGRIVKITTPRLPDSAKETSIPYFSSPGPVPGTGGRKGWGLEYTRIESTSEAENLAVEAEGRIILQDGRAFWFQARLHMGRSYSVQESSNLRAGDAARMDPLALNWDGQGVRLTENKSPFDLNADGSLEYVSRLQSGSGFLVLDRNRDGMVNDGGELFGPHSGNGFLDLAAYDLDQSGWIDEADAVFSQLGIWSVDVDGNERLQNLSDTGVGAIATGCILSPFQLNNERNESLGEVVRTGIYLRENGAVGFVQQVNLTV